MFHGYFIYEEQEGRREEEGGKELRASGKWDNVADERERERGLYIWDN